MAYQKIIDYIEAENDRDPVWKFKAIVGHQGPLRPSHPDYNGSTYNVQVHWENDEVTFEPLNVIAADNPVSCAIYARDNDLLDKEGWKRFKTIAKRQKKMFRMANQAKLRSFRTSKRYMYGYEVPRNYEDAVRIDQENGNTRWTDATSLEMKQLQDYQTFRSLGYKAPVPEGYKKI